MDLIKFYMFSHMIPILPSNDSIYPIKCKRRQFSIHLAFAMTINTTQGQATPFVRIFLEYYVFAYGELYVAFSRGTTDKTQVFF
ncbi:hypothetical protein AMTRI_Chr03g55890 [Amborella trichopoda]